MILDQEVYRKAFQSYLRKGTPIEWSLKQERPSNHYIWRSLKDEKVRPSHFENDGKIFAWDNPPPTGNPGEDFGCRCTAEPFYLDAKEHIIIDLRDVSDDGPAWGNRDFVRHYFLGQGRRVTVRETGHLVNIANRYFDTVRLSLENNIAKMARANPDGNFTDDFNNTYDMTDIAFSIGDTTIGGRFTGRASMLSNVIAVSGDFDFYLEDKFIDPLDLGIEVIDLGETVYENLLRPMDDHGRGRLGLPSTGPQRFGIHTGELYAISDRWTGGFVGQIYSDAFRSEFR